MSEITVTVKLRWDGASYYAGPFTAGRVSKLPLSERPWAAFVEFGGPVTFHNTEAEARAAVEQAVIKALGGENE